MQQQYHQAAPELFEACYAAYEFLTEELSDNDPDYTPAPETTALYQKLFEALRKAGWQPETLRMEPETNEIPF